MSQPLHIIRHQLARLARARRRRRWLGALGLLVSLLLWLLMALFALDFLFELDRLQRVAVSLIGLTVWLAIVVRWRRRLPSVHESEIDLALQVERLHGIDSDLVAAIEFTRPEASGWGSPTLQGEVIRQVAQRQSSWDVRRMARQPSLRRSFVPLIISLLAAAVLLALVPRHLAIFARRLALSNEHYPTRTQISRIQVNGQLAWIDTQTTGQLIAPQAIRCVERQPVHFELSCRRDPPAHGELWVQASTASVKERLILQRRESTGQDATAEGDVVFEARLPALLSSLQYQAFLGDAWSDAARIEMTPLPQVELQLSVHPPDYARVDDAAQPLRGVSRVTVLENSRVDLLLQCTNDKPLRQVRLDVNTSTDPFHAHLTAADPARLQWRLGPNECETLRNLQSNVRLELTIVDTDGLQPVSSPTVEIRVEPDRPPEAAVASIHQVVLPQAHPRIAYRAHDDYGISHLRWLLQIERSAAEDRNADAETTRPETHELPVDPRKSPQIGRQLPVEGRYELDLSPWNLKKGDRLRIMLESTDYRGDRDGASVTSQPLYWEVSDEAGVLAAILAADRRTDQDLETMIQQQTQLGEAP